MEMGHKIGHSRLANPAGMRGGPMLKSIALWVLVIASLLAAIAAHMRIRDVEKGLALQRLILEDI
jgi:hypothetical protein